MPSTGLQTRVGYVCLGGVLSKGRQLKPKAEATALGEMQMRGEARSNRMRGCLRNRRWAQAQAPTPALPPEVCGEPENAAARGKGKNSLTSTSQEWN